MTKLTTGPLKEHCLIAEARTMPLELGGLSARDRLTYHFAGIMIGNKEHRALSSEMHADIAAYEVAVDILRERVQEAAAHYAPIVKPPEPKPEPKPSHPDVRVENGKTIIRMPGRPAAPSPLPTGLNEASSNDPAREPAADLRLPPSRRNGRRWDCICGATNDPDETHCAECLGFRASCEEGNQGNAVTA